MPEKEIMFICWNDKDHPLLGEHKWAIPRDCYKPSDIITCPICEQAHKVTMKIG
jgi:hypothetical protein